MAKYNLDDDTPYGVASADFPITFYDRPQLMFGNLLRGDVDGLTRAMLSPDKLTPTQIKSVRDVLMPGKHVDPILKTVTDIATNPLVIAGLVVGLWKFPVGTTEPLLALRRGLLPKAAAMDSLFSGLHGAIMNLRTHPGLFEKLNGVVKATAEFKTKYYKKGIEIFNNAGGLSKEEYLAVSARLDGLHTPEHDMLKVYGNEPEIMEVMGGQKGPIMPGLQGKMSPRAVGLSDKLRGMLDGIRGEMTGDPIQEARYQAAVEKKGMTYGKDVEHYFPRATQFNTYEQQSIRGTTGIPYRNWVHDISKNKIGGAYIDRPGHSIPNLDDLKKLEDAGLAVKGYSRAMRAALDRQSGEAADVVREIWDGVRKTGLEEGEQRLEFTRRMTDYYTRGPGRGLNFVARLGKVTTANETLDSMARALQQARFGGVEAVDKELTGIGRVLAEPPQYSLNLHDSLGRYTNTVAQAYAWHGTGLGPEIMEIVERPGEFANDPWGKAYAMDNLIPHVRGLKSEKEMARSLNSIVHKQKIYNWLDKHPMIDSIIGPENKKWVMDYYKDSKFLSSLDSMSSSVAHNFYLSTLGLNVSASIKNSLQPFITTAVAPGVGLRGLWYGLRGFAREEGLMSRYSRYAGDLIKGVDKDDAFNAAFPEFVKDAGEAARSISSQLAAEVERGGIHPQGVVDKIKSVMMFPFSTTETGNRLLAYYSGRHAHLFHNAAKLAEASAEGRATILKEAGEVGQTLNMIANFPGGPLEVPRAIMNWSPAARQFMHFPLRYMGFLHGSLRLGADPSKLDWGTIGRGLATSTAAYLTARDLLGVDISGGLMTGALPIPEYEKSPFYPFPFVPPIAQVVGTAAQALLSGDTSQLAGAAAMAVPGGIAVSRAYRTFSPKYADYTNPTDEGRVPLYDHNRSLIGTLTPMELTLRAIGLRPTSVSAEAGAAKWIVSQRDRLRGYRRDYTQALSENETQKADKIKAEFQRVYPELGELQVKKSDLKAIENRKQISRLNRIEKGIPTAYRPIFSQVIGEAGLGRMTEDIEQGGTDAMQRYYAQLQ